MADSRQGPTSSHPQSWGGHSGHFWTLTNPLPQGLAGSVGPAAFILPPGSPGRGLGQVGPR